MTGDFEILNEEISYNIKVKIEGSSYRKEQAIQQARDYIENHFKETRISIGNVTITIPQVERE